EPSVQLSPALIQWLNQLIEPNCDLETESKGSRRFNSAIEALQALKQPISLNKDQASEIIRQPAHSKIKLSKTPAKIDVFIPAQGFTPELLFVIAFAIFWNSFLVVWTGAAVFMAPFPINLVFALFSIPFWTVGLGLIGSILFSLCGKTKLKITSKQISLTYECLGIRYQKPKATSRQNITAIERFTANKWRSRTDKNHQQKTPKSSAVVIWANGQAYSIRTNFIKNKINPFDEISKHNPEDMELNWLAQELSQWLKIPVTGQ
ncbi:MAG: hypothetical protein AAFN00_03945, partial [Cyanobacteria bacterium J06558_2]